MQETVPEFGCAGQINVVDTKTDERFSLVSRRNGANDLGRSIFFTCIFCGKSASFICEQDAFCKKIGNQAAFFEVVKYSADQWVGKWGRTPAEKLFVIFLPAWLLSPTIIGIIGSDVLKFVGKWVRYNARSSCG